MDLEGNDWKLATAVAGLDSLYVTNGIDQTYKLSHRAAKLLGSLGEKPEVVCEKVKKSFGIRSGVFHGNKLNRKEINAVPEYLTLVYDYLRKSIILFLFLNEKEGLDKKAIIDYIDDSLIGAKKDGKDTLMNKLRSTESKLGCSYEELGLKGHMN